MCNCTGTGNSCGCSVITGRRGRRGEQGVPGTPGTGAQVLYGDGPPSTNPSPVAAYALYEDTATDGHWWIWTPGSPGSWTDTGVLVSGVNGVDGRNAYTVVVAAPAIPAAQGWIVVTVPDATNPATAPDGGNAWMTPGQVVFVETAGYFGVVQYVSDTQVLLINLRDDTTGAYLSNAVSGPLIAGSAIVPGGIQGPAGIPVEYTTGAPDPTVAPSGGASGSYVQSGAGGTYWYYNGATAGPWTDTGISVTGPAGATGATGAAGHSPAVTHVTSIPVGAGTTGDIRLYQPPGNDGFTTFYYVLAGT